MCMRQNKNITGNSHIQYLSPPSVKIPLLSTLKSVFILALVSILMSLPPRKPSSIIQKYSIFWMQKVPSRRRITKGEDEMAQPLMDWCICLVLCHREDWVNYIYRKVYCSWYSWYMRAEHICLIMINTGVKATFLAGRVWPSRWHGFFQN